MRIIKINSEDNVKFLKRLKWYKSIFYKNTFFKSDDRELQDFITALNIKSRKERINFIYDISCKEIDIYFKNINFCGFKNNKCYAQQYVGCNKYNGCCRKCIYQSTKGCTTSNLTCKLFFCSEVKNRYEVPSSDYLKLIPLLTRRQKIILKHDYFSHREDVLKDLYIGSVMIFVIRLFIRVIFNLIKLAKNNIDYR